MRRPDGLADPHMYITPFRLYDVRMGRWNTRDPIFDPSASPYEGMGSNPISLTDVLGLSTSNLDSPLAPAQNEPAAGGYPASGRGPDIDGVASYWKAPVEVVAQGPKTLELTEDQKKRDWSEGEGYWHPVFGEFNYHKGKFWYHADYRVAVRDLMLAMNWGLPQIGTTDLAYHVPLESFGFDLANVSPEFEQILTEVTPSQGLIANDDVLFLGGWGFKFVRGLCSRLIGGIGAKLSRPAATALTHGVGQGAAKASTTVFRSFTKSNYRHNLQVLTGKSGAGMDAHHIFPQGSSFQQHWNRVGLNIHDPKNLTWWQSGAHKRAAGAYNKAWDGFFRDYPNANLQQIQNFGNSLMKSYGF